MSVAQKLFFLPGCKRRYRRFYIKLLLRKLRLVLRMQRGEVDCMHIWKTIFFQLRSSRVKSYGEIDSDIDLKALPYLQIKDRISIVSSSSLLSVPSPAAYQANSKGSRSITLPFSGISASLGQGFYRFRLLRYERGLHDLILRNCALFKPFWNT